MNHAPANLSASAVMPAVTLRVKLDTRSYDIHIGAGLLDDVSSIVKAAVRSRLMIVSNTTIFPLYGEALTTRLREAGEDVVTAILPDGEIHKDWQTLNNIFDALIEHACDRQTVLIALGGGVIGDMAVSYTHLTLPTIYSV